MWTRCMTEAAPEPLLVIARLLLVDRPGEAPRPGAVACAEGRIVAVGTPDDCRAALPRPARTIELSDALLLPGFVDAHVHVLAAAVADAGVDCSPGAVRDVREIIDAIAEASTHLDPGEWVRATGYEETMLHEGRPPTRAELDRAVPDVPVRLIHRTGHAEVLNSAALSLIGLDERTPEPPGAAFGRSLEDGRLDGLLIGMRERIEAGMPLPDRRAVDAAVRTWAGGRAAAGVTTLVDASPANGASEVETFDALLAAGAIPQGLILMQPVDQPDGLSASSGKSSQLRRGETKVMLRVLEHEVYPDARELAQVVRRVVARGGRVAVHAPTPLAVRIALDAFDEADAPGGQRIEHAPMLDEGLLQAIRRSDTFIVAQPGLLTEVRTRYEQRIDAGRRRELHPWRRAIDMGVRVAFSSDAPVSRLGPLQSAAAASVDRPPTLAPEQSIEPLEALYAWTAGASEAAALADRGRLQVGLRADLVLLRGPIERDPAQGDVLLSVIEGEVVYHEARAFPV